jgi:hypothetical protein
VLPDISATLGGRFGTFKANVVMFYGYSSYTNVERVVNFVFKVCGGTYHSVAIDHNNKNRIPVRARDFYSLPHRLWSPHSLLSNV